MPDERLADAEQQLDHLVRLDRADHAGQHAEDSGFRARRRELRRRRRREQAPVARAFVRLEDRDLTLEAIDAPVHDGLVVLHRRVVQEIAGGEVVRAVDDDVVLGEDAIDVRAGEALLVPDDLHIGIERLERLTRRIRLRRAEALRRVNDLALQVGRVDDVRVDDAERSHARGGEVERGGRPETAGADEEHLAAKELLLPGLTDLGDEQVPAVALRLLGREARVGLLPGQSRVLPAVESSGHGDDVAVAKLGERVGGHRGPHAARAIQDGGLVLVGDTVLRPLFEVALGNVDGPREMPFVPLVLLADVRELDVAGTKQVGDLLRRRFLDALLDLGEVIAVRRHSCSLVADSKPTAPVGNSSTLVSRPEPGPCPRHDAHVETLYFDVLQFLYHLALAILVGGAVVLGAAAAPAIFASVRSRGEAGAIFGGVLGRYDGLAILCVVLIIVPSVLKATAFEVTGAPETRLVVRWLALLVLCGATLYSSAWANTVARTIRAQTPAWDGLSDGAPLRREFASMHRSSRRAMTVAIFAGIVALFLS